MAKTAAPPTPRWVKGFSAFALVLLAVFVVLHVTGRGLHGHSEHLGVAPATHSSSP